MRSLICCFVLCVALTSARAAEVHWHKQVLLTDFVSEGAAVADLDNDGQVDLVSGAYWWRGPEFEQRFEYREVKTFDPRGYSDHFFSFAVELNGDGQTDIISVGFPGREAIAYLHPGNATQTDRWPAFVIADQVSNESPALIDFIQGGLPELVCSRDGQFGYYQAGEDPTARWNWVGVSASNVTATPFGHGMGVGDVDGDGRLDLIDPTRWWKQPSDVNTITASGTSGNSENVWKENVWALQRYGGGGAQILVHDFDGDGLNDILTSFNAHGYGLAWFAQKRSDEGESRFIRHDIMGDTSLANPYGVVFSQLHALAIADIDGDGSQDLVTGKRYWAHGGKDPGGGQAPVLYWFSGAADENGEIAFQPHLVDDTSGVGTEVVVADLNGDGKHDIVSSNKKGVAIHFQHPHDHDVGMRVWNEGAEDESNFALSRSPQDAVTAMEVPDGFSVDLIASEPDLAQPIAMCFDARGRIWVAEGFTYPRRAEDGQGQDRIVILEDTNSDGSFETKKVFAEGLNLVSGIEVGFGGVWVGAAPYFLFIADSDGDDVADSDPIVLLDGWGYQDTHETLNSFTWGPDGWLYGCHGVFTHSRVGRPGTPDTERTPLNAAIWRYHPTRHQFEVFAWGGSNQWGIDYNDQGDWFMECCVIPHLFHVIQGARYHRQAGQHFNPYIYEDLPTIADHLHYGDGSFASMRDGGRVDRELVQRTAASTSMVGGGHAHCGMAIYLGDTFPDSYYGDLFFHNLHGHRVVRESVASDGSGYVGHHRPDLVRTVDHAFVGVTVMLGPDGSLYFSDWHDPQTCHNRDPEIWDRSNGRVFRLRYGDEKSAALDLVSLSDNELVERLTHRNAMIARQAAHQLHQRAAAGTLDLELARGTLGQLWEQDSSTRVRLRVLWAKHCCGLIRAQEYLQLLDDHDPHVRGWAIQLYAERSDERSAADWSALAAASRGETSLVTLRYLASALQRMPISSRLEMVATIAGHPLFDHDKNLPLLTWYAVEAAVSEDPDDAMSSLASYPLLKQKVLRRAANSESGRAAIVSQLASADRYDSLARDIAELNRWLPETNNLGHPPKWEQLTANAQQLINANGNDNAKLLEQIHGLGMRFGDSSAFPIYRQRVSDSQLEPALRAQSLELLRQAGDPEAAKIAVSLLEVQPLQEVAVRTIVSTADPSVAGDVIAQLPKLPPSQRNDLINYLATRASTASLLLSAIENETLDRSLVSAVLLRQIQSHEEEQLRERVEKIWGRVSDAPGDFQQQKQAWTKWLSPPRLSRADIGHGRHIYDQVCGNCHKLFGDGKGIGPDLTGSNRKDLNYILENVLAPNAIIGSDYQVHAFLLDDGRLITGLIQEENENLIRIVMSAGTEVTLDPSSIESRKLSAVSLMPTGQFEKMPRPDVVDLVAYLASDSQVAPQAQRSVRPGMTDPDEMIEAESLIDSAKPEAGQVQSQDMQSFPDKWSGNAQLWWTGARPGAKLVLETDAPLDGPCYVSIHLTTALDYPIMRAQVNDLPWKSADLFTEQVHQLPEPLTWSNVQLKRGQKLTLTFEMTGANPEALKRWMLGIDRIEFLQQPSAEKN